MQMCLYSTMIAMLLVLSLVSYGAMATKLRRIAHSTSHSRRRLVSVSIRGDNEIPSTAFPLGKCQGDCDSDDQCLGSLVCYQRNSGEPVPPGCSGTPVGAKDYCYDPSDSVVVPPLLTVTLRLVGDNKSPATAFPLGRCQGDCDSDDDCAGNLICFQRDTGQAVPGCTGTPDSSKDYCVRPEDLAGPPSPVLTPIAPPVAMPASLGGVLKMMGDNGSPASVFPLGRCQGDCDSDDQCAGNLVCFQRDTGQTVPGCTGTPDSTKDYCVRTEDLAEPPSPVLTPIAPPVIIPAPSGSALRMMGDDGSPASAFPLGRCQGDCDNDDQCAGNLVCFQRDAEQAIPGCTGAPEGTKDYCIRPEDLAGPPSPVLTPIAPPVAMPAPSGGALKMMGDDGSPTSAFPLGRCQGDCDSDDQCDGNLVCFQRDAEQAVPGCTGTPDSTKDYCIRLVDLTGSPSEPAAPTSVSTPTTFPSEGPTVFVLGKLTNRFEGLFLSQGLTAQVIARSGDAINFTSKNARASRSSIPFHLNPDGAAIFELNNGAYVYVSNSETSDNMGGVYGMEFDRDGNVRDYRSLLTGTNRNCNGGRTPWDTWVSCEEVDGGQCYQVDPKGTKESQPTVLGGETGGFFEAMAYDDRTGNSPAFFVTEDVEDGALRRFRPSASAKDGWNMLHGEGTMDYLEIVDETTFRWTSKLSDGRKSAQKYFPNCEGIAHHKGMLVFVSKTFQQLFRLDLDKLTYTTRTTKAENLPGGGSFSDGPDHVLVDSDGSLYFTEDGGSSPGVFVYEGSEYKTLLEAFESRYYGDETTGIAFSPDRKFLFFCIQEYGILFRVSRMDDRPFDGRRVLAWKVGLGRL